ncbi:MAG: carboxypeptidase regulatory-like domain-containing protein, partial [Chloroflexi bacterium]|nr:carboxypeptidase regulatory-like domain-containing protein [Chloroflexota bacterium]
MTGALQGAASVIANPHFGRSNPLRGTRTDCPVWREGWPDGALTRSGAMKRRWGGMVVLSLTLWVLFSLWHALPGEMQGSATVSGVVLREDGGPAAGATVRQQTATSSTRTAADGHFVLGGLAEGQWITVTAWLDGYYIGWQAVTPTVSGVTITVRPYPQGDN